jgi:hypothetical protein
MQDATEVHTNTLGKIITHKTQVGKGYLSMVPSDWEPYQAKHIETEKTHRMPTPTHALTKPK